MRIAISGFQCGPCVFAYGETDARAQESADTLLRLVEEQEAAFDSTVYSCRSANVSLYRHRTRAAGDPREQKLSAFPR